MKKILLTTVMVLSLKADLIDIYRYQGIEPVIKSFESNLTSEQFWLNRLKNRDLKFGYFEIPRFILLCNKTTRQLWVYKFKNRKLTLIKHFDNLIVGKLGDKEKEGDLRTPIGDYRLIDRIKPKNPFYGPLAFVTNYPNTFDKLQHKDGYGIWIHGKPLDGEERPDLSKGCIVLDNDKLLELGKILDHSKTELFITQKPFFATKKDIASILTTLYKWREAWRNSNIKNYAKFYDKNFQKANGMKLNKFLKYKSKVFDIRKNQNVKIYFSNIEIMPYQNIDHKIIYKITFFEKYIADKFKFEGEKELYMIKRGKNFKILIEN